jgi:hypothetical protein
MDRLVKFQLLLENSGKFKAKFSEPLEDMDELKGETLQLVFKKLLFDDKNKMIQVDKEVIK